MVRINLINPKSLSDQHLIAEYDEILMLLGYVRKYPDADNIPKNFCLGKGHIRFFKDKLVYLKKRHELIKKEMVKRGFKAEKSINLREFSKKLMNGWKPRKKDIKTIKKRLKEKIKPGFRYYSKAKPKDFFIRLVTHSG